MSELVVNRFRDFVQGLNLESDVISLSNDGTNTTVFVENVFHIRAFVAPNVRQAHIDGDSYDVLSVDYKANSVVVPGVLVSAEVYKVDNPFYWHGTLISTANEINLLKPENKLPMIYLNEIIDEEWQSRNSGLDNIVPIRLAFADYYSNDWTREDHYNIAMRALYNLAKFVQSELQKGRCLHIGEDEVIKVRLVPKWGEVTRKGTKAKTFNEYLDAIEWRFNLKICKCD